MSLDTIKNSLKLLVRQMRWEADDVLSLSLVRPDGSPLPKWELGAHIDVVLRPDLIRQYSLCGDPDEADVWTVAVLLDLGSTGGSRYIHEELRPGMHLQVIEPRNNFPLVDADNYLFIAGGIGVTPLVPMVRELARRGVVWQMLYGGRHRSSMAFLRELTAFGDNVVVRPEDEYGLLDLAGSIGAMPGDSAIYCCGPELLIDAVLAEAERQERPGAYIERFKVTANEIDTSGDTDFELVVANTNERLHVPADKTIIQVLEEHGIFVPTSCTDGYCGTCESKVIAGIPDHRDEYLSDEIRATNETMMICVGRSKTPELVLELDI